jgi:hypothetical protein
MGWWARRDSNPQPSRYERPALPLSYRPLAPEKPAIADAAPRWQGWRQAVVSQFQISR